MPVLVEASPSLMPPCLFLSGRSPDSPPPSAFSFFGPVPSPLSPLRTTSTCWRKPGSNGSRIKSLLTVDEGSDWLDEALGCVACASLASCAILSSMDSGSWKIASSEFLPFGSPFASFLFFSACAPCVEPLDCTSSPCEVCSTLWASCSPLEAADLSVRRSGLK